MTKTNTRSRIVSILLVLYRLRPCGGAAHSGHRAAVPGLRTHRG